MKAQVLMSLLIGSCCFVTQGMCLEGKVGAILFPLTLDRRVPPPPPITKIPPLAPRYNEVFRSVLNWF